MDGNNPTNIQATAETGGLDDENSREVAGSGVDQKMSVNDAGPLRSPFSVGFQSLFTLRSYLKTYRCMGYRNVYILLFSQIKSDLKSDDF